LGAVSDRFFSSCGRILAELSTEIQCKAKLWPVADTLGKELS
jgi:hypothetical protein